MIIVRESSVIGADHCRWTIYSMLCLRPRDQHCQHPYGQMIIGGGDHMGGDHILYIYDHICRVYCVNMIIYVEYTVHGGDYRQPTHPPNDGSS